jgi:hypothetical protein
VDKASSGLKSNGHAALTGGKAKSQCNVALTGAAVAERKDELRDFKFRR